MKTAGWVQPDCQSLLCCRWWKYQASEPWVDVSIWVSPARRRSPRPPTDNSCNAHMHQEHRSNTPATPPQQRSSAGNEIDFSHSLETDFILICNCPISSIHLRPSAGSSEENREFNERAGRRTWEAAFSHLKSEQFDTSQWTQHESISSVSAPWRHAHSFRIFRENMLIHQVPAQKQRDRNQSVRSPLQGPIPGKPSSIHPFYICTSVFIDKIKTGELFLSPLSPHKGLTVTEEEGEARLFSSPDHHHWMCIQQDTSWRWCQRGPLLSSKFNKAPRTQT